MHVGYKYFPVGTVVRWSVSQHARGVGTGRFVTAPGPGMHFYDVKLPTPLVPHPKASVTFVAAINGKEFRMTAGRAPPTRTSRCARPRASRPRVTRRRRDSERPDSNSSHRGCVTERQPFRAAGAGVHRQWTRRARWRRVPARGRRNTLAGRATNGPTRPPTTATQSRTLALRHSRAASLQHDRLGITG